MRRDNNNRIDAQLVSKTEPSNQTHLTSADVVYDVLSVGDVVATTEIDIMWNQNKTRQR